MFKYMKTLIIYGVILGLVGALLHEAYKLSGKLPLVGLFTPINESTWEHMKLFFFPMLVIAFILNKKYKAEIPLLWSQLLATTLLGTWLIPVLFYTYRGILGFGISALDIATYYVSLLISFLYLWFHAFSIRAIHRNKRKSPSILLPLLTIFQAVLFVCLTYYPLGLGAFREPG